MMTSFRNNIVSAVVVTVFVVLQQRSIGVDAFPTFAGSCVGGAPAVGGPHTSASNITTGSLQDFDITFTMNKFGLTPNTDAVPFYTKFESNLPFEVAINATNDIIKGCFIRFETEDKQSKDVFELTPLDNTQIAPECSSFESATGICHTDDEEKNVCSGTVTANVNGRIMVDVTVVIDLEDSSQSTYAYSQYVLESIVSFPPFTSAPTVTKAPATMIPAPVMAPTMTGTTTAPAPLIGNFTLNPTPLMVGTPDESDMPSSQPAMIVIGGMSDMPSSSPTESMIDTPSGAPFIIGDIPSSEPSTMNGMDNMPTALPLEQDRTPFPSAAPVSAPISHAVSFSTTRFITTIGTTTVMGFIIAVFMM